MLVLVPQQVEMDPLLNAISSSGFALRQMEVGRLQAAFFEDLGVWLAVAGHGKTELALRGQYLVDNLPAVSALICAGAAGSLHPEVSRGDVVIGTCSVEHDYKLRFKKAGLPELPTDERIVEGIRNGLPTSGAGFRVHFGPIASGDEDIVDPTRARELQRDTGALCVAWEGAGAARVARFNNIPFAEIRAVTDSADASAASDFRVSLATAMPNLANVLLGWAKVKAARH